MRHGIAAERDTARMADDDRRPLTPDGERKVARVARVLQSLGCSIDVIFSSPVVRSKQTADIVADVLGCDIVKLNDALRPGRAASEFVHLLNSMPPGYDAVLAVGHEPDLGRLTGLLLAGTPDLQIHIRKGGIIRMSIDRSAVGSAATLEWVLPPKVLLRIG